MRDWSFGVPSFMQYAVFLVKPLHATHVSRLSFTASVKQVTSKLNSFYDLTLPFGTGFCVEDCPQPYPRNYALTSSLGDNRILGFFKEVDHSLGKPSLTNTIRIKRQQNPDITWSTKSSLVQVPGSLFHRKKTYQKTRVLVTAQWTNFGENRKTFSMYRKTQKNWVHDHPLVQLL